MTKTTTKTHSSELAELLNSLLGRSRETARKLTEDELVATLATEGFDEESLRESLCDGPEAGGYNYACGQVGELCLASLIQLWIECRQGRAALHAEAMKARRVGGEKSAKTEKPAAQARTEKPAKEKKLSINDVVFSLIDAGAYTKAEIVEAVKAAIPGANVDTINRSIAANRNPSYAKGGKVASVSDDGIYFWSYSI